MGDSIQCQILILLFISRHKNSKVLYLGRGVSEPFLHFSSWDFMHHSFYLFFGVWLSKDTWPRNISSKKKTLKISTYILSNQKGNVVIPTKSQPIAITMETNMLITLLMLKK